MKVIYEWLLSFSTLNMFSILISCISNTNANNNTNSNENIYNNNSNENIALNEIKTEELRLSFKSVNNINNDDCESNSLKSNHQSNQHEPNKLNVKVAQGEPV